MNKKTIQEILDEAYSKAYEAICKTLDDNGIKYDDNNCDSVYVDDAENKETYYLAVTLNKCDEYDGEN